MKIVALISILLLSGCSVTIQLVLYQRGGTIAAPTGQNETLSETATSGGGSPSFDLTPTGLSK